MGGQATGRQAVCSHVHCPRRPAVTVQSPKSLAPTARGQCLALQPWVGSSVLDFAWSPEQVALNSTIVEFARRELNDDVIGRDRRGEFNRAGWRQCAELGIQGLFLPEEYGGGGADALTTVGVLESLGYGCRDNGLIFSL